MKILKIILGFVLIIIILPVAVLLLVPQPPAEIEKKDGYSSTSVALDKVQFDGRDATLVKYEGSGFYQIAGIAKLIAGLAGGNPNSIALIDGTEFSNGVIEVDIHSTLADGAIGGARGFVGIAFRVADNLESYEAIYLRPANGRVDDPVRRGHAIQYVSHPEFHFNTFRASDPEVYENPADIGLGEWIKLRIKVDGDTAVASVNGAVVLDVTDLKLGAARAGGVALWVNPGTVAHFANLTITPK